MRLPFSKKQLAIAVSFVTSTTLLAITAQAEDDQKESDAISIEEMVITAQKREQNMQDTPIAMSAINAEMMEKQNIADISDAALYMPNVVIKESPGGSTGATASIRGAVTGNPAITWEPTVGIYVDGVFVAKNVGGLFDVAEMERIEVLRGPQGTLYGKNTLGGAINLITRKPGDEFGGTARLKVGNYNYREEFISVDTGKFGDVASFNIAVNKRDRDGFYENNYSATGVADSFKQLDSTAARFAALFDVADNFEIYYTFDMNEKDNTPPMGQFDLASAKRDNRENSTALDGVVYDRSKGKGHALHLTWDATDELTVKSISAYRKVEFDDKGDYDGHVIANPMAPPIYVIDGNMYAVSGFQGQRNTKTEQLSQEFQLIGNYDSVSFATGLFYFDEDSEAYNPFTLPALGLIPGSTGIVDNRYGVKSESVAAFGQADWSVTDALILTAGLRWTREKKEAFLQRVDGTLVNAQVAPGVFMDVPAFGGNVPRTKAEKTWNNVTPMAAISYFWDDNINTYFKVSQGWKSGGFNGEAGPDTAGGRTAQQVFETAYKPEKVTAYELGMKARWFNNRLQTNVAYFFHDAKEMQLSKFLVGAQTEVINAGKAEIQGLELDVIAQISRGFSVNASYGLTDARYKKHEPAKTYAADPKGKKKPHFPYTPKHTASLGLDYVAQLSHAELRARLDYSWTDDYNTFDVPDTAYVTHVKSHGILNGRIALANMALDREGKQTLEIGLWGKNLTNAQYRINGIPVTGSDVVTRQTKTIGAINFYGDPRTVGVDLAYKW